LDNAEYDCGRPGLVRRLGDDFPNYQFVGDTIQINGQSRIVEDSLYMVVLFPTIGLLMGFLQYILLRRYLPQMVWWIAATFLGWLMPFLTGPFIITIFAQRNDTFFIMLGLLLIGASMAVPQWWLLRQRFRHASWWIFAYGFGWCASGLLNMVTTEPLPVLLAIVLIPSITTGMVWWYFLDWLPGQKLAQNITAYG
jgi:hypothetical protein